MYAIIFGYLPKMLVLQVDAQNWYVFSATAVVMPQLNQIQHILITFVYEAQLTQTLKAI